MRGLRYHFLVRYRNTPCQCSLHITDATFHWAYHVQQMPIMCTVCKFTCTIPNYNRCPFTCADVAITRSIFLCLVAAGRTYHTTEGRLNLHGPPDGVCNVAPWERWF